MKIIIDVPEEFSNDCILKFQDFWDRVVTDMKNMMSSNLLCSNYEIETAEMFRKAFKEGEFNGN